MTCALLCPKLSGCKRNGPAALYFCLPFVLNFNKLPRLGNSIILDISKSILQLFYLVIIGRINWN